jgi:GNAT superfamily N-acetyltransferase/ketosteroid isomerase-like protein
VTRGLAALRSAVEAAREIADDLVDHYQDVLAAEPGALLMRWTTTGRGRAGGGDFEWPHLRLCRFGADGCLDRIEAFGTDQELEALARFDALAGAVAPATRLENAAARAQADFERAWRERRWDDAVASFTPAVDLDDRRALVGVRARGEEFFRNLRLLFETPSSAWRSELLATRGERHALFRARFSADAGGAPIEDEHLSVVERDAGGRARCIVVFDADQLDAAWAELDSCYEAAEGAGDFAWSEVHAWHVAFERRDFEALARILSPDFQLQDHRLLGLGTLGAARYVELMRSLVELAPDVRHRIDHFVSAARGALAVSRMHGARDGGPFELTRVSVRELDASGRLRRIDHYDPGQLDLAFARLAELREPEPIELRLPNAATRSMDRYSRAWQRRDWDGVAAEFAPAFRFLDRQRFAQLEQDREGLLDSLRRVFELEEGRLSPGREADGSVLATWGERLALARTGFVIRHRDVGTSELANLSLVEVDGSGRRTAMVAFDADASDAARAELERRFYAGEAAEHPNVAATMQSFVAAFAARDWDALGALFAEDVAVHDHRRLGWEPLRGRRAYVAAMRSLVELSPDVRLRLDDVRLSARGVLWVARWAGTHEGGPYDTPWISVSEHDAAGVVRRLDQYDLDQLEAARARFEALRTGSPASAPNRVLRALERFTERFVARDWTAVRALAADGFVFEDRRRRALVRGGVEMWIENFAFVASWADRHTRIEPIAAHGDRIALQRVVFSGEHRDSRFEGDFLRLVEVDAEGRLVAWLHFDPEDRAAALAEAHARAGAVSYRVERARAEDVPKLARVELAANTLFTATAHGALVAGDVTAPEELAHAAGAGLLWVARAPDGEPVGFALVEILDGRPHLEELDVDPAHGRRGLGRALLGAVLDWARGAGHAAVTLTTFRDVPWNAPFYERMGFRALAPDEIGPGLAATMREEAARGLDPATRVAMRLELDR